MRRPLCMLCLAFVLSTALAAHAVPIPKDSFTAFDGKELTVSGTVQSKSFSKDSYSIILSGLHNENSGETIERRLLCYLSPGSYVPKVGSQIMIKGKARAFSSPTNPGQFDQRLYYLTQGINGNLREAFVIAYSESYSIFGEALFHIRRRLCDVFDEILPQKESGTMKAMMLGDKSDLDQGVKELYQATGISHILAISGLHITLIGMLIYQILLRLPFDFFIIFICKMICKIRGSKASRLSIKTIALYTHLILSAAISVLLMWFYGMMTDMSPSALRAIIMFSLNVLAKVTRRSYDLPTALALSCATILIENPLYLYNAGFLLSFSAICGLSLLTPVLSDFTKPLSEKLKTYGQTGMSMKKMKMRRRLSVFCDTYILSAFGSSLAATIFTTPIVLWSFYSFPAYSIFINLLVIPLVGIIISLGLLAMPVGLISATLGTIVCYPIRIVLYMYEQLCLSAGFLPHNTLVWGKPSLSAIIWFYSVIVTFVLFYVWRKGSKTHLIFIPMLIIAAFPLYPKKVKDLEITMLDVGQGDSFLIRNRTGLNILVDGGSTSVTNVGKYRIEPALASMGVSAIDCVFISHEDADHINGILEMLEDMANRSSRIKIHKIILPITLQYDESIENETYMSIRDASAKANVDIAYVKAGDMFENGELTLQFIHPADSFLSQGANEHSEVFILSYGQFDMLFTGDVEKEGEESLTSALQELADLGKLPDFEILKVAHHGSKYTTSEKVLSLLHAEYSFISCAKKNMYGHPAPELLERLSKYSGQIIITKDSGAVKIRTDGKRMEISPAR